MFAPFCGTSLLAVTLSFLVVASARADPPPVTSVLVQGNSLLGSPNVVPAAETEPTSVINRQALDQALAPTGNYDQAVALSPSVLDINPNGPGLGETQTLTIRGFTDGQYNVTFDSIPFGDSDDFTHHSAAYFITRDLDSVTVDRGPGDATTIGNATFGGTISLRSIDPMAQQAVSPDIALGTLGTLQGGARLDTGNISGTRLVIDGEAAQSNGALDNVEQRRGTLFAKLIVPLGARTELTVVSNLARTVENDPPGATKAEIASAGPGAALSSDPRSQAFEGYNQSTYRTDISYAALTTQGDNGWTLSDTVYTYGLDRHFVFGLDPNGETPNGTTIEPSDVPGQAAKNGLRAFGDIAKGSLPLSRHITLAAGFWLERQTNARRLDEVDATLEGSPNLVLPAVPGAPGSSAIEREQADSLVSFEPYAQVEWRPVQAVELTAGLKGAVFSRSIAAPVMEATRLPTYATRMFGAALPSFTAHIRLTRGLNVYAQAARGFLAPPLQFFDVSNPVAAAIAPEATWNFQTGVNWHDATTSAGIDAYEILFTNEVGSRTIAGETTDFDEGSATYRGLEAEGTKAVGGGFAIAGSASLNSGHQNSEATVQGPVPNTPQGTFAIGLLYNRDGWNASVFDRWTGGFFGDIGGAEWIDPVNTLDLSLGRRLHPRKTVPIRLQAQLFNLLDSRRIDGLAGYTAANGTPLFWTQAGRSLFVSATASF